MSVKRESTAHVNFHFFSDKKSLWATTSLLRRGLFFDAGRLGRGEKKARGVWWEGKERKHLPIVPRALNAIFTGKPSGSLCIGERSNCYFHKNKHERQRHKNIKVGAGDNFCLFLNNLQVKPGSAQIKTPQRSMARVRELVLPLSQYM